MSFGTAEERVQSIDPAEFGLTFKAQLRYAMGLHSSILVRLAGVPDRAAVATQEQAKERALEQIHSDLPHRAWPVVGLVVTDDLDGSFAVDAEARVGKPLGLKTIAVTTPGQLDQFLSQDQATVSALLEQSETGGADVFPEIVQALYAEPVLLVVKADLLNSLDRVDRLIAMAPPVLAVKPEDGWAGTRGPMNLPSIEQRVSPTEALLELAKKAARVVVYADRKDASWAPGKDPSWTPLAEMMREAIRDEEAIRGRESVRQKFGAAWIEGGEAMPDADDSAGAGRSSHRERLRNWFNP